jgi:succinoglycan biosynthesis protein ExoO
VPPIAAVVIPAFNPGPPLIESVDSALQQTLSDIEVVVIDDGSESDLPTLPADERLRASLDSGPGAISGVPSGALFDYRSRQVAVGGVDRLLIRRPSVSRGR